MLRLGAAVLLACVAGLACADEPAAPAAERAAPSPVWVALGGETFSLELAADPAARQRGLSGRAAIARNGGMLFVYPDSAPRAMVMRDCPAPIDVAFLDASGRIVATHEMVPEPPRGPTETAAAYERRLRPYRSGAPARFAIELAGGRLRQLGLAVGGRVAIDAEALATRAR